jgi:hypothetical protein
MHITSFLYDTDPARLAAFEAEAGKHFQFVQRVVRQDGRVIAFALYSNDLGYDDLIYTLPEAIDALSGILAYDIEIVSAWEGVSESAQRVWPVAGSDGER